MFKSRSEVYEGRLSTRIVQNYYYIEKIYWSAWSLPSYTSQEPKIDRNGPSQQVDPLLPKYLTYA